MTTTNGLDWVIILAAGEGQRVRALTLDTDGTPIPKQFCPIEGRTSMLRWTVDRAKRLVPAHRLVCVVAGQHRRWWERDLEELPVQNVVVQPENRGTAPGILLPLMAVLRQDPQARVLILPSDHHVDHEDTLCKAIRDTLIVQRPDDDRVVLLGMIPEEFHGDYGWIVPSDPVRTGTVNRVRQFVEKPESHRARRLMARGALMNSLILIGRGSTLLELYRETIPDLLEQFREVALLTETDREVWLRALYRTLPKHDFSRDVLERTADRLSVMPVPDCGWSDLGTPARLNLFRNRLLARPVASDAGPPGTWFG